jgi:hypothetical protein
VLCNSAVGLRDEPHQRGIGPWRFSGSSLSCSRQSTLQPLWAGLSFSSVGWSPLVFVLIGVLLFALESLQPTERRGA